LACHISTGKGIVLKKFLMILQRELWRWYAVYQHCCICGEVCAVLCH